MDIGKLPSFLIFSLGELLTFCLKILILAILVYNASTQEIIVAIEYSNVNVAKAIWWMVVPLEYGSCRYI